MKEVIIEHSAYNPDLLTIQAGTEVVFRNENTLNHTITADDFSFDSGDIVPGADYHYSFDSPGECSYHCEYHPDETGNVIVE